MSEELVAAGSADSDNAAAAATSMYMALWLIPPQPILSALSGEICSVAKDFGGPCFLPHVTLFSGIRMTEVEAIARLQKLQGCLGDGQLHLRFPGEITGEDVWNQIAVAVAEEVPELDELHRVAWDVFKDEPREGPARWSPPLGKPHLSLAYGRDPAVRRYFCDRPQLPQFECRELAIVSCDPPCLDGVTSWRELSRVSLNVAT
eukprot:TRINITY_DN48624_c0_g1_i1.p1 TRINITY_DN48624_c0_g1~~TRINITY_DN48624_c0_g1_i1.p1  ORF type:complete len:204 (-),score=28.01 TRINITY_DN48624_c0_g1_i1:52-663(-)